MSFNWPSDFGFQYGLFYKYLLSKVLLQIYFKSTVLLSTINSLSLSLSLFSLSLSFLLFSLPFMSQRHTGYLALFSLFLSARVLSFNSVARSVLSHSQTLFSHLSLLSLSLSFCLSLWHWLFRVFAMNYVAQATLCFVSLSNNLLTGLERKAEIRRICRLNSLLFDFGWKFFVLNQLVLKNLFRAKFWSWYMKLVRS